LAKIDFELRDKVALVTMGQGENRLNIDMCSSLLKVLDRVEKETEALTLVVTSAHERIWSNGFDTDWIKARLEGGDAQAVMDFLAADIQLRRRMLTFPLITVAAINGHVFGGGAVFSCCFDFRFMRSDRGFFAIPAIDLGYPVVPGSAALLRQVLPVQVMEDILLAGRRFTGLECEAYRIVSAVYPNDQLLDKVMAFASGLNKGRWIVGQMKKVHYARVLRLMEDDLSVIEKGSVRV